jgi:phosphohistidine phosphatase
MARTLVLIRHSKAAEGTVDIERPLAQRGIEDAGAIGDWLAKAGIGPNRVVVSPARRARQTWEGAAARLPSSPAPILDSRIYDNEAETLLDVVHDTPADVETLVLVGHNPSFEDLAHGLDDGDGDDRARAKLRGGFKTSGTAVFDIDVPWNEVATRAATLREFTAPRG